jgi:glucose/sorbosone dehydrogenase
MRRTLVLAGALCLAVGAARMVAQTARVIPRPPAPAPGPPKPEDGSAAPDGYAPIPEWLGQTRAPRPPKTAEYAVETVAEGLSGASSSSASARVASQSSRRTGRSPNRSRDCLEICGPTDKATLVGRVLVRLVLKDERVIAEQRLLTELNSRIRGVSEGPDGALYVLTDGNNGKIVKLVPRK